MTFENISMEDARKLVFGSFKKEKIGPLLTKEEFPELRRSDTPFKNSLIRDN